MNAHELAWKWEAHLPLVTDLAKQASLIRRLTAKLAKPEGYEGLKKVERDLDKLAATSCPDVELQAATQQLVAEVRAWLDLEWDRRRLAVGQELIAAFDDAGIPLEERGGALYRFPLTIHLDPRTDSASLLHAGEVANEKRIPLATQRVFAAWDATRAQLARNQTDPDLMVGLLEATYNEQLAVEAKPAGARVRLPDLHFRAFVHRQTAAVRKDPRKGRVKPYPRYQFAWDLGLLLAQDEPVTTRSGLRIELIEASESASRSAATSLLVEHQDGRVVSYGALRIL
jgi:hypothetical protein